MLHHRSPDDHDDPGGGAVDPRTMSSGAVSMVMSRGPAPSTWSISASTATRPSSDRGILIAVSGTSRYSHSGSSSYPTSDSSPGIERPASLPPAMAPTAWLMLE